MSIQSIEAKGIDMDDLDRDYPQALLATHAPPCLSLYQPTHPAHPDKQQDVIRFRNLVRTLETSLQQGHAGREVAGLLAPLRELGDNDGFWNRVLHGLAVLRNPDGFHVYRLQRPVPEIAVVADSFHTKPLLRIQQSADRYQVLGLSRSRARLFEGNRDALSEVDLGVAVPATPSDATTDGARDTERATRVYGASTAEGTTRHGTAEHRVADNETERFFRAVDRAVAEQHSQPSGLPLLLAALPENHNPFRKVSTNPLLLDAALDVNADDLTLDELRQRAWQAIEPAYLRRLAGLLDTIHAAVARHAGSLDLADIARAAQQGRVATMLIDADRHVAGRLDPRSGAISLAPEPGPAMADLLDDVGEQVLRTGGEVVVVPTARMPSDSGAAAAYRY
jgi:hypothetical protein